MTTRNPDDVHESAAGNIPASLPQLISNMTVIDPCKENVIELVFKTRVNHNNQCTTSSLMSGLFMSVSGSNNDKQIAEALKMAFMCIPPGYVVTVKIKCLTGIITKLKVKKDKDAIPR